MARTIQRVIDNVRSAVDDVIEPVLQDIIFQAFPTLAILERKGRVMKHDPGAAISWPLVIAKADSGSYAGAHRMPAREKQLFDRGILDWKNLFADTVVSGPDLMKARGPYAAFQLSEGVQSVLSASITEETGKQMYADGFGTDFDGFRVANDDGALFPTYATVPRATVPGMAAFVDGAGATFTLPYIVNAIGKARKGAAQVDLITTTQELWDAAQNRAMTQQVFYGGDDRNRVANLGFDSIRILNADLVFEPMCPEGNVFGHSTENLELAVMPDRMWSFDGIEKVQGADAYEFTCLFMGNLINKAPRESFHIYNVTQ
jgi:hypothetical protein